MKTQLKILFLLLIILTSCKCITTEEDIFKKNINPNNSYSGVLIWDCAEVSSGVYVIQVLLNGKSINIPVVLSK